MKHTLSTVVWGRSSSSTPDLCSGVYCRGRGRSSLTSPLQALCTPPKPLWSVGVLSSICKALSPSASAGSGFLYGRGFPSAAWFVPRSGSESGSKRRDFRLGSDPRASALRCWALGEFLAFAQSWGHRGHGDRFQAERSDF